MEPTKRALLGGDRLKNKGKTVNQAQASIGRAQNRPNEGAAVFYSEKRMCEHGCIFPKESVPSRTRRGRH